MMYKLLVCSGTTERNASFSWNYCSRGRKQVLISTHFYTKSLKRFFANTMVFVNHKANSEWPLDGLEDYARNRIARGNAKVLM